MLVVNKVSVAPKRFSLLRFPRVCLACSQQIFSLEFLAFQASRLSRYLKSNVCFAGDDDATGRTRQWCWSRTKPRRSTPKCACLQACESLASWAVLATGGAVMPCAVRHTSFVHETRFLGCWPSLGFFSQVALVICLVWTCCLRCAKAR